MKREANLPTQVGEAICALLGEAVAGPTGAAVAGGACGTALKGINNVIDGFGNKNNENNIYNTLDAYNKLANTLKSHGCTLPQYTDPKLLRAFFTSDISKGGLGILATDIQNQTQFVNTVADFINAGSVIQHSYPSFVNDAVQYCFNFYRRNGFELSRTIEQINDLMQKAVDPRQSFYVISILKGNYEAAFLFNMLAHYGNVNEEVYKDFSTLAGLATKMLGKQSAEILDLNTLMDQKAAFNAKAFADQVEIYKVMIPIEKSILAIETDILDKCFPVVKGLLKNPAVAKILPYIAMISQLKNLANYIKNGAFEPMNNGGIK